MRALALDFQERKLGIRELAEPRIERETDVLVRVHEVGVCGTDRDLAAFRIGRPPADSKFLIPGHECVGQVVRTGRDATRLNIGDWVAPVVRHGCQPACAMCAQGRADLCQSARYTESGIAGRHGFWRSLIVEDEEDLIRVPVHLAEFGVLVEPLSVVEKAIERAFELHQAGIAEALVLGAGPLAMLAAQALLLRGVDTKVFSTEPADHPRAQWMRNCGVTYLTCMPASSRFDLIVEACGSATAALAALPSLAPLGIMAVLGAPDGLGTMPFGHMILNNQALFGSVNAAPIHYRAAVEDLGRMDVAALRSMIERRRFLDYAASFSSNPDASPKIVHPMADPR